MNQGFLKSLATRTWGVYVNHPSLVLSTWTGWRYPGIPRLTGHYKTGRLPYLADKEGTCCIFENFAEACQLADAHPSGLCYYWVGNDLILIMTKPEQVLAVLNAPFAIENAPLSREKPLAVFKAFFGVNLNTIEPSRWGILKNIYISDFNPRNIKKFYSTLKELAQAQILYLKRQGDALIDLDRLCWRFVSMQLLQTHYGFNEHLSNDDVIFFNAYFNKIVSQIFTFANFQKWAGRRTDDPEFVNLKNEIGLDIKQNIFDKNKSNLNKKNCFFKKVAKLYKPFDVDITLDAIFGDLNLLVTAAIDGGSVTSLFVLKLLAQHPDVLTKLRSELDPLNWESEDIIKQVSHLPYLTKIIAETLRLYPPIPFLPRSVTGNPQFILDDVPLSKGDTLYVPVYFLHHSPKIWGADAEEFKPERNRKIKGAYIPFGGSTFACPGEAYALKEMKFMIASLAYHFDFAIENNSFEVDLSKGALRPTHPTEICFTARARLENTDLNKMNSCTFRSF